MLRMRAAPGKDWSLYPDKTNSLWLLRLTPHPQPLPPNTPVSVFMVLGFTICKMLCAPQQHFKILPLAYVWNVFKFVDVDVSYRAPQVREWSERFWVKLAYNSLIVSSVSLGTSPTVENWRRHHTVVNGCSYFSLWRECVVIWKFCEERIYCEAGHWREWSLVRLVSSESDLW